MRDTGGVEVNGTLIWLGPHCHHLYPTSFELARADCLCFQTDVNIFFICIIYDTSAGIMISANAGALVNNVLINNALRFFL